MDHFTTLSRYIETSSLESGKLTEIGYFARYLFLAGMYLDAKAIQSNEGMNTFNNLVQRARQFVKPEMMKVYRIPHLWIEQESLDNDFLHKNADQIAKWYNGYVRDKVSVPADEKELFKKAIYAIRYSHFESGLPHSALDQIEKYAKMLSPTVGTAFANTFRLKKGTAKEFSGKQEIDALYNQLTDIVYRLTKKKGEFKLPNDTVKEIKVKGGDEVSDLLRYQDIRKKLKILTTNSLYVILSGGQISADNAAKEMKKLGFRDFPFPTSADGYTGDVGLDKTGKLSLFTKQGKQIQGLVASGSKVTMNKKYDPTKDDSYYFLFKAPGAVSYSRGYTTDFKQTTTAEKHEKTTANTDKVGAWVKTAERDIFNKDPMRNVPAAVFLLLYLTAGRIGSSKENQSLLGKAQTYGISTLRKSHVKVTKASIILDYNGKKGMHQRHTLKLDNKINKRIGTILKSLLADKGKNDLVFAFARPTSRTGAIQEVNPTFFRSYLKSIGVTINPHALRHIRGTELAKQLLAKEWQPSTKARTLAQKQREAETYMKEKILKQVGVLLGHKSMKAGVEQPVWQTAMKNYIHPAPVIDWFKAHHLGVPKWAQNAKIED